MGTGLHPLGKRFEARTTRAASSRDLVLLVAAAVMGAIAMILLAPVLVAMGRAGPELTLVIGTFLVSYMRRFGVLGAGHGSQAYIGQLLAYDAESNGRDSYRRDRAAIAAPACVMPRVLS